MPTSHAERIVDDQWDLVFVCNLYDSINHRRDIRNVFFFMYLRHLANRTDFRLGVCDALHV